MPGMAGDGSINELCGIMELAMLDFGLACMQNTTMLG